jgi:hypothetical protein
VIRRALAALAAVSLLVLGLGSPALAAGPGPSGYVSVWEGCGSSDVGYCGAAWPLAPGAEYVCHSMPTGSNDRDSAVDNHATGKNITFFDNGGCVTPSHVIYNGTYTGALTSGQGKNKWSSYWWWS